MKAKKELVKREFTLKALENALKASSVATVTETFALDLPIVVAEKGIIYRVYKDGRKEFVGALEQHGKKLAKKRFSLK
ncbi:MAG: hypothetical protein MUD08_04935 [Cytophagales bacterium]|jgi:hypothetical protein|nr:hypothetical protein [Cytophagales bacterium]